MEILINELSLTGQFADEVQFISEALLPITSLFKALNKAQDTLFKRQDLWEEHVTPSKTLHDMLTTKSDEATRFKSLLASLILEPFWESSQKHLPTDAYLFHGRNVAGQSLAEACERDRVVVSFRHDDFGGEKLPVMKNEQEVVVYNLLAEGDYVELAYQWQTMPYAAYFAWKFDAGQCSLLDNKERFRRTRLIRQGQTVFEERDTGRFWYLDNLHKNHYEVFDANKEHWAIADMQGQIDETRRVSGRKL